jgi:hypothetical protein
MNTIQKYINKTPWLKNLVNPSTHSPNFLEEEKGNFNFKLSGDRVYHFQLGIDILNRAIMQAEDIENPSRQQLYSIYNSLKDLHVKSQMRTAIFKVVSQPWVIVNKDNEPQKELTELFQKKWFNDLNEHIISTEFWGHSLIYFTLNNETGEFTNAKLFPRIHVLPEKESIIPNLGDEGAMFSYKDIPELAKLFIEVKSTEPLGLLKDISRYSILKDYAIKDWGRSSEKWGDPHVILKSSSQSNEEDDAKEEFLANFGNNGYAIVSKDDEIELLERGSSGSSHNIFLDLIKLQNDETSKGINGQTATADEKSFVGSSEVQERILNDYTLSRLKYLMFYHNETTLPYLINYNNGNTTYKKLEGMKWMPVALMEGVEENASTKPTNAKKPKLKDNEIENSLENPFI